MSSSAIGTPGSSTATAVAEDPQQQARRTRPAGWRVDTAAVLVYVAAAVLVTAQLWAAAGRRTVMGAGGIDLQHFEVFLAHGVRVLTEFQNPLFTDQLNAPDGVNLMANTSVLGLSLPLAPITLIFGTHVAVLVALVLCLAGTAAAWYYVLSRHLVSSRAAAFLAGAVCGFAPGMISQAVGHVNFTAQFLIPFIGWRVIRLGESGRAVRNGIVLGLLIIWQAFLNEEFLLFTAVGCLFFVGTWAVARRSEARARFTSFIRGLAVAAALATVVLAYPLYFQFFGPGSYEGLPFDPKGFYADAYSYFLFSSESLAGNRALADIYAQNTSEENTFFGFPLVLLALFIGGWLWRTVTVRAAVVVAAVFALMSLGMQIVVAQTKTGVPGPYRYLSRLPLIDMSLPSRYALMVAPMVGILIAVATQRVITNGLPRLGSARRARLVWCAALAVALLPIAPTPLAVVPTPPPAPHYILSGAWRQYVGPGESLVGVPLPKGSHEGAVTLRWAPATKMEFRMPGGYFIGPSAPEDRRARFSSPPRPTAALLEEVARTGVVPQIDDGDRQRAIEDLRYWRAALVVLGPQARERELRTALEELLGPGQRVDDVWVWPLRDSVR